MGQENCRKPERALSARFVETVTEPGKYFDGQGLFLRVTKNGARQWVQRITIRGKRCELGLGSPPAVPLAIARKLALENRGKAMLGGDPLAEKRDSRGRLTFAAAVDRNLAAKLTEFGNEKHRKQWRSTLDTYAAPVLGRKQVADIGVQDVLRLAEGPSGLVVAEGIETALSLASGLLRAPATIWAALSTSGLHGLTLPPEPGQLTVAPDRDRAGLAAAHALAVRTDALGWRVSILPAPDGHDWNDILAIEGDAA